MAEQQDPPVSPFPFDVTDELQNFLTMFQKIRPHSPGEVLDGIEIYGETTYLSGDAGGDHIVYLNFDTRHDLDRRAEGARCLGHHDLADKLLQNRDRIGVLLADVSGHQLTDALMAAMLHQAFLTGVMYELDLFGEVTTRLLENLNSRFYKSSSLGKYVTLIYGEISKSGGFRFISAGHPAPLVFSAEFDCLVTISSDRLISFYPLGMFPSEDDVDRSRTLGALRYKPKYTVNEVNLMSPGDVLLLFSDGLSDHHCGDEGFVPDRLQNVLRRHTGDTAEAIYRAVVRDMAELGPPDDDVSLVVIKRRA